ncbi:PREDICTED: uncharacterized protein LOC104827023 isoform X2 [Tarenaya hassleriana]|uniref:uncharacterized protein LOC104827023 isoform X2 n=1 Tax=Tarenaya hassleriana TaxID=28532 RepID=UPI00053C42CC|nr:PREDICTED: uncharacterized protein LOC104827023 isoform X2 [Tarenaya hassleriana]
MDEDETNPSPIDSDVISHPVADVGSGRKRKLLAEVLELPLRKQVCHKQTSLADPCSPLGRFLGKLPETESGITAISHSFSGDDEFAECSYATYDYKTAKASSDESTPSASNTGGFHMSMDPSHSNGSSSLTKSEMIKCYDFASSSSDCMSSKDYDKTQTGEDLNQLEFLSSEFVAVGQEQQLHEEEIEEPLCCGDPDAGSFLLSSARWSVSTRGD